MPLRAAHSDQTFFPLLSGLKCPYIFNMEMQLYMFLMPEFPPIKETARGREYKFHRSEAIVKMAIDNKDYDLCGSFTEPALLFEYYLDAFSLVFSHIGIAEICRMKVRKCDSSGMDRLRAGPGSGG